MELSFHGATGDTTGSCHLLHANGCRILLDCGLYQGRRAESYERNRRFGFDAARIDAVVQSHAHVDHCGKLPMLVRAGFGGRIHATHGTRDLAEILLHDSANIQVKDAEHLNRERWRERSHAERCRDGRPCPPSFPSALTRGELPPSELVPLYLDEDVDATLPLFKGNGGPDLRAKLIAAMPGLKERAKTLVELADGAQFLIAKRPLPIDDKAQKLLSPEGRSILARLIPIFEQTPWESAALDGAVRNFAEHNGLKLGAVAQPLRAALTGRSTSPGIFDVLVVLGKAESLGRLADQTES